MTKKLLSLTTTLLVLGAGWANAAERQSPVPQAGEGCANHSMQTFKVVGRALKERYRAGETARVAVSVVRSTESFTPDRTAAPDRSHRGVEDAYVGVALTIGNVRLAGLSITDEDGSAIVEIKIRKTTRPGWVVAGGRAWKDVVSEPCPVTEEGFLRNVKMFRIVAKR